MIIPRQLLSIGLALYVPLMFISASHPLGAFSEWLQPHLKKTLGYIGLNNPYRFWAPDPLTDNLFLDATVRYSDGSTFNWVGPHYTKGMSDLDHQKNMPFFYWQYWMLIDPANSTLYPDVCKYIADVCRQENKQVQSVTLYKNSQPVSVVYPGAQPIEQPIKTECLLQYEIKGAGDNK